MDTDVQSTAYGHKNRLYAHCTVVNYTPDVGKALKEHAGYERFIVPGK